MTPTCSLDGRPAQDSFLCRLPTTLDRRDCAGRRDQRLVRTRHRFVPERRDLARAAPRVDRQAAVALPGVRREDRQPRQHPGRLVAPAPRPLPKLRRGDLGSLPVRRAPHGCAVRRGRRPVRAFVGAPRVSRARRRTHRALRDRPRALHPAEPHPVPGRRRRDRAACRGFRRRARLGRVRTGGIAGAIAFAIFFTIHIVSPRGMGFGDVRLSFLLGFSLGWLGWGEVAGGLFSGFLYGAVVGVALIAFKVKGAKAADPLRALPRGRSHDLRPVR